LRWFACNAPPGACDGSRDRDDSSRDVEPFERDGQRANRRLLGRGPQRPNGRENSQLTLSAQQWATRTSYVDDAFAALADPFVAKSDTAGGVNELYAVNKYQVRGGVFTHGVGSVEANTYDLNLEFATPRILPFGAGQWWGLLILRFDIGGFLNTAGRTQRSPWWRPLDYSDLLWVLYRNFGRRRHQRRAKRRLGDTISVGMHRCVQYLANSLGYQFSSSWSLMGTWNHMSNGNSAFGVDCPHNKGVNNFGLKAGYVF